MEKLLKIKETSKFDAPPIKDLLSSIKDDANLQFYKLGTSIHFSNLINPNYALVSLIDLIELSPFSSAKPTDSKSWHPVSSFKWLYLIISIASKQLFKDDPILESEKLNYVISKFDNFITNADRTTKWSLPIISGAIVAMLRLAEEAKIKFTIKNSNSTSPDTFEFLSINTILELLSIESRKEKVSREDVIKLIDFSERNIIYFCLPYSSKHSNFDQKNIFKDQISILFISLSKLLLGMIDNSGLSILSNHVDEIKKKVQYYVRQPRTKLFARKLLISLFDGNEETAIHYLDTARYTEYSELLNTFYNKSSKFTKSLSYPEIESLTNALRECADVALEHSHIFIEFLTQHKDTFQQQLIDILSSDYYPEIISLTLKLLTIGQVKLSNISLLLEKFIQTENKQLQAELEPLLIGHQDQIVQPIIKLLPHVLDFGFRSQRFFEFLCNLVSIDKFEDKSMIQLLLTNLMKIINQSISDCQNLPHIYSLISKYIDIKGYYFQNSVCLCNFQARQLKSVRIEEINSYNKYLYNAMISRFKAPMTIKSVQLRYSKKHFVMNKVPKTVQVYATDTEINNPNQLLSDSIEWRRVCELEFAPDDSTAKADLNIEIFSTALKFQYVSFYEDYDSGKLSCPNCHNSVFPSPMGICPICQENIFACNNCRLSNVSHVDWFLCAECGNSNYCRLEYTITARQDFSHTAIRNDSDCSEALKKCDDLVNSVEKCLKLLNSYKKQAEEILSPLYKENRANKLTDLYNDRCKNEYLTLTRNIEHLFAIRESINKFKGISSDNETLNRQNKCFNCHKVFVQNALQFIVNKISKFDDIIQNPTIPEILDNLLEKGIFNQMIIDDIVVYLKLKPQSIDFFIQKVMSSSHLNQSYAKLFIDLTSLDDKYKYERIAKLLKLVKYLADKKVDLDSFETFIVSLLSSPLLVKLNRDKLSIINSFISFLENSKVDTSQKQAFSIMILFEEIKKLLSNESILRYYLLESHSNVIWSTFTELLLNISKIDNDFFEQIFKYILSMILQFESNADFLKDTSEQQLVSVLLKLLIFKPIKIRSLLLHSFDFIEKIVHVFTSEIKKLSSSIFNSLPSIQDRDPLKSYSMILKFIFSNPINFFYILNNKYEILTQLIDAYQFTKSPFLLKTDTIDLSFAFLEHCIARSISPFIYFDIDSQVIMIENKYRKLFYDKYGNLLTCNYINNKCRVLYLSDEKETKTSKADVSTYYAESDDTLRLIAEKVIKSDKKDKSKLSKYIKLLNFAIPIDTPFADVYWKLWVPIKGNETFEFSLILTSETDEQTVFNNYNLTIFPNALTNQ